MGDFYLKYKASGTSIVYSGNPSIGHVEGSGDVKSNDLDSMRTASGNLPGSVDKAMTYSFELARKK